LTSDVAPALQKLVMEPCNLGSLSSQSVFNRMLKAYKETRAQCY